ncbi:AidA/PixA family protein [Photorhabdus antumapuensis]|uniref:AidA/PixA family protein n=1 Tax=Photorhabdus antumapuensis TaxID=2862867 RepID=UPI001CED651F|nr:AidA/PixA family protein [Photorhabdus antumapuensis]MCA6222050.1 inclusion body family protein [Photorhabdus antumapuensis]
MGDFIKISKYQSVDILICVDVEAIISNYDLSKSKTLGTAKSVHNKYFYYITSTGNLYTPKNNAQGELEVTVNVADDIRWRPMSLTQQFEYTVLLCKMRLQSADNSDVSLITLPQLDYGDISIPYLAKDDNNNVDNVVYKRDGENNGGLITRYYHQSTAQRAGRGSYVWYMKIYRKKQLIGYIGHDPYITVLDD